MVAIGKIDRDAGREPSTHVQNGERGAFPRNNAARKKQDARRSRRRRRGRLLLRCLRGNQAAGDQTYSDRELAAGSHAWIVVEKRLQGKDLCAAGTCFFVNPFFAAK